MRVPRGKKKTVFVRTKHLCPRFTTQNWGWMLQLSVNDEEMILKKKTLWR
jgi:hypothetical protein